MKRVRTCLAMTVMALALAGLQSSGVSAAPLKRLNADQMKVQRVDPNLRRITLLCSPKYKPSANAKTASIKGGSYTCTLVMPIPPGKICRTYFNPSAVDAKVLPGGQNVRLVYRCTSSPW